MMEWLNIAPWLALTVVTFVMVAGQLSSRRAIKRLEAQLRERCETLGREMHSASSGTIGMGQRLIGCERQLHELRTTVEEMRQNDPLRVSYDEASRLVDLGADIEDLMNTCGISRPEAELVSALKRRQAVA